MTVDWAWARSVRPRHVRECGRWALAAALPAAALLVAVHWGSDLTEQAATVDAAAVRVLVPGTVRLDARSGVEYTVYTERRDTSLRVSVTDEGGRVLDTRPASGDYAVDGHTASAWVTFEAPSPGPVAVRVDAPPAAAGRNAAFASEVNIPREQTLMVLTAVGLWVAALVGSMVVVAVPLTRLVSGSSRTARRSRGRPRE